MKDRIEDKSKRYAVQFDTNQYQAYNDFKMGANYIIEEQNQINKELLEALKEVRKEALMTGREDEITLASKLDDITYLVNKAINKAEQHIK